MVIGKREFVVRGPTFARRGNQTVNPRIKLRPPKRYVFILHVPDHSCPVMGGGVVPGLKPLDPSCGTEPTVDIFPFVTILPGGCRQSLALDRQQSGLVVVFSPFDPD